MQQITIIKSINTLSATNNNYKINNKITIQYTCIVAFIQSHTQDTSGRLNFRIVLCWFQQSSSSKESIISFTLDPGYNSYCNVYSPLYNNEFLSCCLTFFCVMYCICYGSAYQDVNPGGMGDIYPIACPLISPQYFDSYIYFFLFWKINNVL